MGCGITSDELQDIVSSITNFNLDECDVVSVSDKVVHGLFSQHGKLLKLLKIVQVSSLDQKQAKQACKQTWDAMFAKLDSYTEGYGAHSMADLPRNTTQLLI